MIINDDVRCVTIVITNIQSKGKELRVLASKRIHCVNANIGSVEIEEKEREKETWDAS
jgi:hypothetical protein